MPPAHGCSPHFVWSTLRKDLYLLKSTMSYGAVENEVGEQRLELVGPEVGAVEPESETADRHQPALNGRRIRRFIGAYIQYQKPTPCRVCVGASVCRRRWLSAVHQSERGSSRQ